MKDLYFNWENEMFCSNCDDETFKKRMARVASADMCYGCELDGEIPQFDYCPWCGAQLQVRLYRDENRKKFGTLNQWYEYFNKRHMVEYPRGYASPESTVDIHPIDKCCCADLEELS